MKQEVAEIVSKLRAIASKASRGEALSAEESALIGGEEFRLEEGPRLSGSRVKYPRELKGYAAEFGTTERTLKRWVQHGRNAKPAMDLPPLHRPGDLAAWYSRHHKNEVPAWVLGLKTVTASKPVAAVEKTGAPAAAADGVLPLDLATFGLQEGEAVRQARALVAAAYQRLDEAYKSGRGDVDLLQARYVKALDGCRKIEASEREWAKKMGDLISRVAVERDINLAVEQLRMLRESQSRRVRELCPNVPPEYLEIFDRAMRQVREQEDRVFQRLDSLERSEQILDLMAA